MQSVPITSNVVSSNPLYNLYIAENGVKHNNPNLHLLRHFFLWINILIPNNVFITQDWHDITKKIVEQTNRLPVFRYAVMHRRSHIRMALDISVIGNWKINNPTCDVVNDVNQDFSLKYSNNKMGINDVINKMSINNTRANLLH